MKMILLALTLLVSIESFSSTLKCVLLSSKGTKQMRFEDAWVKRDDGSVLKLEDFPGSVAKITDGKIIYKVYNQESATPQLILSVVKIKEVSYKNIKENPLQLMARTVSAPLSMSYQHAELFANVDGSSVNIDCTKLP